MVEYALLKPEVEVASPDHVIVVQDHLCPARLREEVLSHDLVVALDPSRVELSVGGEVGVEDAEGHTLDLEPAKITFKSWDSDVGGNT